MGQLVHHGRSPRKRQDVQRTGLRIELLLQPEEQTIPCSLLLNALERHRHQEHADEQRCQDVRAAPGAQYGLQDVKVKGDSIFIGKQLLCRVYGLSNAYNNKGAAIFDASTFKGVNIIIDEVALEKGQRKTFDVVYNLKMQIENIVRSERENVKVFMMLNNTEDCPELMAMFGFIPIEFGVYKLKRKHCVVDYIPNNTAYDDRRKKALANEIDTGTGNFTNKVVRDLALLYKGRLTTPVMVVKYSKDQTDWFTIWEGNIICPYNGEKKASVAMKRYIDDTFIPSLRDSIIEQEDVRAFKYKDILTQSLWRKNMELIKK